MKFTVKHTFKHGYSTFEVGNSHDATLLGISDEEVRMFYDAGWVDIEGEPPGPDIDPTRLVTLSVASINHGLKTQAVAVKEQRNG